jgi:hypothetical protein
VKYKDKTATDVKPIVQAGAWKWNVQDYNKLLHNQPFAVKHAHPQNKAIDF